MRCLVTAGATYEPLDQVRRLTNFSTGKLGAELARFLCGRGHEVELLLGEAAAWRGNGHPARVRSFSTGASLLALFAGLAGLEIGAVFHAAAVGDFQFGRLLTATGAEIGSVGKIPTSGGPLLVELRPAPKLLPRLRALFPRALLVGWKYEVDGGRDSAVSAGLRQLVASDTDVCVVNGPAYGAGFGVLQRDGSLAHTSEHQELFQSLAELPGGGSQNSPPLT